MHGSSEFQGVGGKLRLQEVWVKGWRHVVCHNPQEAAKDAADREGIVKAFSDRLRRGANSLLDPRPIFHQWDTTIKGPVFGSFQAVVLLDELPRRLADRGENF